MKDLLLPSKLAILAVPVALTAVLGGCTTSNDAMQNINKDWNRAIRAAHVYPINPLTQDIQPGDIFFTDSTIEDLSDWDENSGKYVPLDHLITRLYPGNYAGFYSNSFSLGSSNYPPRLWLKNNEWSNAPAAAFPGYTFTIRQGGALNVALPIQGVPVGLGLMGAKDASGTVTIGDVHTYGIDELSLLSEVKEHFSQPTNAQQLLLKFPSHSSRTNRFFLQVVSRVYTTGKVTVSMLNESSLGGGVSVGSITAAVPQFTGTNAAEHYSNLVATVNALTAAGPTSIGGSLKFTHLSGRSLALDETFPRPLVIGYLGFSVPLVYRELTNAAASKQTTVQLNLRSVSLNPAKRNRQMDAK